MNRMQIKLALGMKVLGIKVNSGNYREVCNATFLAEERGVHISPSFICYNAKENRAYSPFSHESEGEPSWNLACDLGTIEEDRKSGIRGEEDYELDEESLGKLKRLRKDIERKGLKELLRESRN
ncbi:hypothetical protein CMI46_02025 [Candidatus Pacearchaeota archaeon]|nr:hypothetical protein [Candidatus Pacearchaeota archaeon]|tara:strand:+ start:304 stop:675 length:372 start_codon:yes stop_codon:yes gene_type:complete